MRTGRSGSVIVLGLLLVSCSVDSRSVSVPEYSKKIVGNWEGTLGELKETMTIDADGTFVCQLHPRGFIAETLSQSETTTIRGTWGISGAVLTLTMTNTGNEPLKNIATLNTIVSLKADELVLKSDSDVTSAFHRLKAI